MELENIILHVSITFLAPLLPFLAHWIYIKIQDRKETKRMWEKFERKQEYEKKKLEFTLKLLAIIAAKKYFQDIQKRKNNK